jgi:hypothetical protein
MRTLIISAIFYAFIAHNSTLNYVQEITALNLLEAKKLKKHIENYSERLNFLNCPLKLIEHQYNGPESVYKGLDFLEHFLYESAQIDPDYDVINDRCLDTLDRLKQSQSRALSENEINTIKKYKYPADKALKSLISNALNAQTQCYVSSLSLAASFFVGSSLGAFKMECFSPLGRRFQIRGPSLGIGGGYGASLMVPNSDRLHTTLTYSFSLFNNKKNPWYDSSKSSRYIYFIGPAEEYSNIYDHDYRIAVGLNIVKEWRHHLFFKKQKKSFFLKLLLTDLFDDMAETALKNS